MSDYPAKSGSIVILCICLALQACATSTDSGENSVNAGSENASDIEPTVVSYENYNDPLIGLNRAIYKFNDFSYRHAVIPFSQAYVAVLPAPVRGGISNVFRNIKTPIYLVNNLLQGKVNRSFRNLARFGINSTIGMLGVFDPANDWLEIEPARTGLEDTLSRWGAGYGVFIMLPLAGPADLKSGAGRVGDYFLNPVIYLTDNPDRLLLQGFDALNGFAPQILGYEELADQAEDPYIFFRNMYLQSVIRNAEYADDQ